MARLLACSAGILISTTAFFPALAQTSDDNALQLEEVVVTAQKRETDLQKTSVSIQVTSGEQLREEGKRRIDEILRETTGVEFQTNAFGSNVFLRGLGNTEGIPGGGEKAVATIIDGAYQYRTEVLSNGTLDVAQVEVMRGSQGTTLGGSSLAGAVSLVSNKPVFEYQSSGSLEGGNYNLLNAEGVLNLPLAENQAVRLAYSVGKRDGYVSSGAGGTDSTNGRLRYRWQVNDDLDIVATYNFQKGTTVGRNDTVATTGYYRYRTATDVCGAGGITCTYGSTSNIVQVANNVNFRDRANAWNDGFPNAGFPNNVYRTNTINTFGAEINWNLGFATFTITPQLQNLKNVSNEAPSAMGAAVTVTHEEETENSRQIELRLASASGGRLQWLGGVYYYYRDTPDEGSYSLNYVTGVVSAGGMNGYTLKNDAETKSAFANGSFSVLDTLRVIAGVRYSEDDKTRITQNVTTLVKDQREGKWSDTTYRAGLEYDLRPDSMLYATYQTGYQPGSFLNANPPSAVVSQPQTTEQLTLGIKNQFFDRRLQLNVEAFDTRYHNRPFQGTLAATQAVNGAYLDTDGIVKIGAGTQVSNQCAAPAGPPPANQPPFYANYSLSCVRYNNSITVPNWLSQGVDIDLSWLPTANDRIDLTAEYLKSSQEALPVLFTAAQIQTYQSADTTQGGTQGTLGNAQALADFLNGQAAAYDGLTPQNSPEWVLNATYQRKFGLASGASITPKINGIYKTKYWSQGGGPGANIVAPGAAYQQAYSLWNAYVTYQSADGKWSATGNVKNVTAEVVQVNYGAQSVQLGSPRTFGVSVNANF